MVTLPRLSIAPLYVAPGADERVGELQGVLSELDLPDGRLSESELGRVVLSVAARPTIFEDLVVDDVNHRWWMTLHESQNLDVRVLSWERDQESDWHDHGGSSGAYVVTTGSLQERFRADDGASITERIVAARQPITFGPSHVHDMLYREGKPAISVHAYSPPLSGLTYYDHSPLGFVARDVIPEESRRAFELAR